MLLSGTEVTDMEIFGSLSLGQGLLQVDGARLQREARVRTGHMTRERGEGAWRGRE